MLGSAAGKHQSVAVGFAYICKRALPAAAACTFTAVQLLGSCRNLSRIQPYQPLCVKTSCMHSGLVAGVSLELPSRASPECATHRLVTSSSSFCAATNEVDALSARMTADRRSASFSCRAAAPAQHQQHHQHQRHVAALSTRPSLTCNGSGNGDSMH